MTVPWALAVPVIIFLAVIVPLWITFHYITIWARMRTGIRAGVRTGTGDPASRSEEIEALARSAERLEQRLNSIETILDGDAPDWKKK